MIIEAVNNMINKGEFVKSGRCVNYAKMALTAWNEGRETDAYAYLDKAQYEFELLADELPF